MSKILSISIFVLTCFWGNSQTTTQTQQIVFNSGQQGMFNSSTDPNPYVINEGFSIPFSGPITWDEGATLGKTFSTGSLDLGPFGTFGGFSFGASVYINTKGYFGLDFKIKNFTGGSMQVIFPTKINTVYPTDNTFDYGDWVDLNTSYVVNTAATDAAEIKTIYPSDGNVDFDMGAGVTFKVGAKLSVSPFPALDIKWIDLNFGMPKTNLLHVDHDKSYYWGEVNVFAPPAISGPPNPNFNFVPGYPGGYPDVAFPACQSAQSLAGGCIVGQIWKNQLPVEPEVGVLSGKFSLPFVNTTTQILNQKTLKAQGDSTYMEIELDLIKMLGKVISMNCGKDAPTAKPPKTPNPYCVAAGFVIENLSNNFSQSIPGLSEDLELWYNVLNTDFLTKFKNIQEFTFNPTIYGKFELPTPVYFKVINSAGVEYQNSASNIIVYTVGDVVKIKYPCFYDEFSVKRSFSIDGKVSSKTYDSINFSVVMDGMGFGVKIPGFNIFPGIHEQVCIPWGYPCGDVFWPSWCSGQTCTTIQFDPIGFPDVNLNTCSLWSGSQPPPNGTCSYTFFDLALGGFENVWHEKTWSLEGFNPIYPADTIKLKGRQMLAVASTNNILCKGWTGTIQVNITNGTPPYQVSWDGAANVAVAANFSSPALLAGSHVATITDANGCQVITGAFISEPLFALGVQSTSINDSCNNLIGNGKIITSGTGGTGTYLYTWSGIGSLAGYSNSNSTIADLQPGQYGLIITDANDCTHSSTYTISQPPLLHDTAAQTVNVSCFGGSNALIDVTMVGGNLPYTYNWTVAGGGAQISNESIIDSIGVGNYSLTVTDALSCVFNKNYPITQPTDLILSTIPTHVDCFNNSTGAIDLSASGGTPGAGYQYLWLNTNAQVMSQTSQDLTNLTNGTYTAQVTDSKNCVKEISTVITQPDLIEVSTANLQNIDCNGNATGEIDISVIGGTGIYSYDWNNDGTSDFDDNQDLMNLLVGVYALTIRDANMCSQNFSYQLTQPEELVETHQVVDVECFGNNTGVIDITVTGGTGPYLYDWDNDGTGDFDDTQDLLSLISGTYILQIKDAHNCLLNLTVFIDQPAAPLGITETHANVLCYGGNSGSIDHTVSGGTSPYSYQWTDGGGVTMTATSEDLLNLSTDTYNFEVTDANLCTENISTLISQPLLPLALNSTITPVDCFGMPTGSVNVTIQGGTLPYIFDWSNDGTGDNDDPQNLLSIVSGNYSFNIIDDNGCELLSDHFIDQPEQALNAEINISAVKCFGDASGSFNLIPFGGTAPYTFDWDIDGTGDFDDLEDQIGLSSGIYVVTIRDTNNCTFLSGGFISQPNAPIAVSTTVVEPSCYGYKNGTVNLTITGGTAAYYFQWGNQNQLLVNNPSESISGLSTGNYFYRVTDANECVLEANVFLNQPDTLNVLVDIQDVSCYNGSDGSIQLASSGGTLPYTYLWSNSSTDEDQFNLTSGEFGYVLLDAQLCEYKQTLFVDQAPDLLINASIQELSCTDQQDAAINVFTYGGTSPYEWTWSNGEQTESIDKLIAGDYEIVILDDNNCSKPFHFIILPSDNECISMVNAFTPNGDDYNDTWHIENLNLYPNAELKIFNRWGNLIFESKGEYHEWDGYYKGSPLPADSYYYILVLNNGVDNRYTGNVTIIR
jgi:gliding motility-associated-like protein